MYNGAYATEQKLVEDEVNYDGAGYSSKENLSNREDKIKKILENTEKYEKLIYFTPEKQLIPTKVTIIIIIIIDLKGHRQG